MDQGIIANFKRHYRSLALHHVVDIIDAGSKGRAAALAKSLNLLESLHMQRQAWNKVTASTIANCFRRVSFVKDSLLVTEEIEPEEVIDLPPRE